MVVERVTDVCRTVKRKTGRRTKDRKVTPELMFEKKAGNLVRLYSQTQEKRQSPTQHWYFGCQQHALAKDPLLHSSFSQQQGHNKKLKVGKMSFQPSLPGRVCSKWRVLHKAMGERGRVLGRSGIGANRYRFYGTPLLVMHA